MVGRRGIKRVLIAAGVLLVLLAVVIITYPWWLGVVLRPAAERFGVSFGKYEKLKDGRFVLTDVVRTNRLFDLKISRVEGFLPHVWYEKARGKGTNAAVNFAEVNGWRVIIHERGKEPRAKESQTNASVYANWKKAERYVQLVRQWAPKLTLLNGAVDYRGREYTFPVVTWEDGKLDAGGVWPENAVPFDIKGKLSGEEPYQLTWMMTPLDLRARLRVTETNQTLNTAFTVWYRENRVDGKASFATTGILPETAEIKALDLKIPANLLKLKGYEDLTGSLQGSWRTNRYTLSLNAHAEPFAAATNLPPADLKLQASGDTNSVRVEKALSTAPGLQVSISQPMEMSYGGKLLSDRAEVKIDADLEKLPWLRMSGSIKGTILLEKGSKFPVATMHAEAGHLSARSMEIGNVQLDGRLNWPEVERVSARVVLPEEGVVTVSGSGNIEKRVLGETVVQAEGRFSTNWLPGGVRFSSVKLNAKLQGALTNVEHAGGLELRDFATPQTQPAHIELSWKARQFEFDHLAMRARAGPAVLWVAGSGFVRPGRTNFVLQELSLTKGDEPYLALANSALVALTADPANGRPRVEIAPVTLRGTNRELVISGGTTWPMAGQLDFAARKIHPDLFQPFVQRSLRGLELPELQFALSWSNGPVTGSGSGGFWIAQEPFGRVGAEARAVLDEGGLTLTELSLLDAKGEIGRAHGFLPVSIRPLATKLVHLSKRDEIEFELSTATNTIFWETVEKLTKVRLTNAAVQLAVHGTTRRPAGELRFQADGARYLQTNRELPSIGRFEGRMTLNEQLLKIPELQVRVADQLINVAGQMQLTENFWTQRREAILQYSREHAELKVEAPRVELAPFTTYLPRYLVPQGRLAIDAGVKPGLNLYGALNVRGVETRPIAKLGVVQNIQADIGLKGRTVQLENLSGVIGGQTLKIAGTVDLSPESVARGYPDIDLKISGSDLPLARNPDVILRSDLDLRVKNGTNHIPVITGDATLRDSFLLRDIATLVPGRVASPKRRPPYFSIEQDPIDDWRLHVRVKGDSFMRVRSPFFQGVVSANLVVNGTLREPMALGDATINSGSIIFPFATLKVRQAIVSMTSEDPYLPRVFAVATGRAFGFDLRMEAEGAANQPVLQFSSVPALSSEQIILMLTTGQIPRQDFGFSTEDRAGKLAFFLGKSLWAKLHPGQPAEERLSIRSGEDITEQGRQTYEVEYKLNDRWSLVGEYDRFGAVNANVKWKLFSK